MIEHILNSIFQVIKTTETTKIFITKLILRSLTCDLRFEAYITITTITFGSGISSDQSWNKTKHAANIIIDFAAAFLLFTFF